MGLLKKQDVGREELMPCSLPEQLSSQEPRTELGAESVSGAGCVLTHLRRQVHVGLGSGTARAGRC